MSLLRPIARNLDDPARIIGLSPMELATCALTYVFLSSLVKGLPFSGFIALAISLVIAGAVFLFNRNFPPYHGVFKILQTLRPQIVSVMPFGDEGGV